MRAAGRHERRKTAIYWVQIDKDTQLERFNDRQNNPEKRWKITDEDWRNREKWDQYEVERSIYCSSRRPWIP